MEEKTSGLSTWHSFRLLVSPTLLPLTPPKGSYMVLGSFIDPYGYGGIRQGEGSH